MSPLMIILLILILVIGSAHRTTAEKYSIGVGSQSIRGNDELNTSLLLDRVNYVTFSDDGSEADHSATQRTRLHQDFQHLLGKTVKKIIQQHQKKEANRARDVRTKEKDKSGKILASNKIAIGEILEEDGWERSPEARRDRGYYKSIIGRSSSGEVRERLSKDLVQVSETLMPTIRRISHSKLKEVSELPKVPTNPRINQGNSREESRSFRRKRDDSKDQPSDTDAWIKKDFSGHESNMKMHAFVVKDEEIPRCCSPANDVTDRRYFMCSGAVLTLKHAITSASCVHFADVHKRNVEANLAVLVGATEPRSYVIKIIRYDMHPDYEYDVNSRNHATNNLAILVLGCSIVAQDVVVPSLPKGINEDVAHVCCKEGCDLITIMENSYNRHIAHIVQAKHLPAPVHDDDFQEPSYRGLSNSLHAINKPMFFNKSLGSSRRIRSPLKLAAAPTFFGVESARRSSKSDDSADSPNTKKRKKTKSKGHRRRKKPLTLDDLFNRRMLGGARDKDLVKIGMSVGEAATVYEIPIMRALEAQGVNVKDQLAAIDWQKVEEVMGNKYSTANQEKMDQFAKNIVEETIRRLENVLDDSEGKGNRSSIFGNLLRSNNRNQSIENFVHVFTEVVASLVPPNNGSVFPNSLDMTIEEKDIVDPPPSNQECPPLGTPVIASGTLIGLVAYTCDDIQTWVEWQYVSIAKNINWIRKQVTTEHGYVGACAGPDMPVESHRRMADDPRAMPTLRKFTRESETEIHDGKVEWKSQETTGDSRRSSSTGNLDHARNPETGTYPRIPKDPWFARNSPLAPQVHRANERQRIFADSRNQRQSPTLDPPAYSANSCYVNPDGSSDCRARGGFNIP